MFCAKSIVLAFLFFKKKTFTMCTTLTEGNDRPWCATAVDSEGVYRSGSRSWGYCDRRCPFLDDRHRRVDKTTPKPFFRRSRPRFTTTTAPGKNEKKDLNL